MKLSPGRLSQLAFEAIVSDAANAQELATEAAAAHAESPQTAETPAITAIRIRKSLKVAA